MDEKSDTIVSIKIKFYINRNSYKQPIQWCNISPTRLKEYVNNNSIPSNELFNCIKCILKYREKYFSSNIELDFHKISNCVDYFEQLFTFSVLTESEEWSIKFNDDLKFDS